MTRSSSSHAAPARRVLKGIPTMIAALLVAAPLAAFVGAAPASATTPISVALRVLLIGSGASDPTTAAWVAALTNEGVPYTEVDATGTSGAWTVTLPPLTAAGNPNEGLFDAVVIADSPADFAGNELDALVHLRELIRHSPDRRLCLPLAFARPE